MKTDTIWRVLVVDDEELIRTQIKTYLDGESVGDTIEGKIEVHTEGAFDIALEKLKTYAFDLLILDVRLGNQEVKPEDEAGVQTLEEIKKRRFLPVIYYTALPGQIPEPSDPLIHIVEKTETVKRLLEVIKEVFETRFPIVNRALLEHMQEVQRKYMWEYVSKYWVKFNTTDDHLSLAYLLARRLALSISTEGIENLSQILGNSPVAKAIEADTLHPMQYYVIPSLTKHPLAGDIYRGIIGDQDGYWVVLSPSCDLVEKIDEEGKIVREPKAEKVVLAACYPLENQPEYTSWRGEKPGTKGYNTAKKALNNLLKNTRSLEKTQQERYHFLPGALNLPNQIVDFQHLSIINYSGLKEKNLEKLASLDSPFAEALLYRFSKYINRLGTPDLHIEGILSMLESQPVSILEKQKESTGEE